MVKCYGFGIRRGDVGVHHNFQDVPREGVDILSKLRYIQVDVYDLLYFMLHCLYYPFRYSWDMISVKVFMDFQVLFKYWLNSIVTWVRFRLC